MRNLRNIHALLLLLLAIPACAEETEPAADAPRSAFDHPEVEPIGGGEGYGHWVLPQGQLVHDLEGLRDRLATAGPNEVITVSDDARIVIDMTGSSCELTIPESVTLASGRGRDGVLGALIASTSENRDLENKASMFCLERDARLSGFRIQGPSLAADWSGCGGGVVRAITVAGENDGVDLNVRIDNNEIFGWAVATAVNFASGVAVDHNHIHHNLRKEPHREEPDPDPCDGFSLGYGVVVNTGTEPAGGGPQAADARIEANLFHHNRHDIASDGGAGSSYTARYNVIHDARLSHSFDVHQGKREGTMSTGIAGESFEISHNTFLQETETAIKLRAVPTEGASIHHNEFRAATEDQAIKQVNDSTSPAVVIDPWENVTASNNEYDIARYYAWFMSPGAASGPLYQGDQADGSTLGGEGAPDDREPGFWTLRRFDDTPMYAIAFGDFDCDGADDAFRTRGSTWEYSSGARGDWLPLNVSSVNFWSLRFGDFDGNGCTDVFWANPAAGRWYVSWNGTSAWAQLNVSSVGVEHLGFGDFDGNGSTDVFKANGSSWRVSWGGQSSWSFLNYSSVRIWDLGFGDFNGDGTTDVFRANGYRWTVSLGGTTGWYHYAYSSVTLPWLGLGDFDGNGTTDVLRRSSSSGKWEISWGATSTWEKTRTSALYPWSLGFADLNGDGATDILSMQFVD